MVADDRAARVLRLARDIAELELRLADCVAQLEALDREAHDEREEVSDGVGQARRGGH
ncbi:MAG TPA: hypothetical protein VGL49_01265 [Acidimicrobiales bacterium]